MGEGWDGRVGRRRRWVGLQRGHDAVPAFKCFEGAEDEEGGLSEGLERSWCWGGFVGGASRGGVGEEGEPGGARSNAGGWGADGRRPGGGEGVGGKTHDVLLNASDRGGGGLEEVEDEGRAVGGGVVVGSDGEGGEGSVARFGGGEPASVRFRIRRSR